MGISQLCVSFTLRRRSKKRTGPEEAEQPPRTTTEIALGNSLVLNEIIARLPRRDVLNCRLVSHSWNTEAISILRRQNAVITIDGHNYQSYLFQLLKTSHKSLLSYKCDQSLKLSVRIEKYSCQQEFDKISLGLATLVRLFESPTCIDSLHVGRGLDWKMHCSWGKLIKSLTHCGAGLRHVTINCAIILDTLTTTPAEDFTSAHSPINAPTNPKALADARLLLESFSFPQLESLNLTLALGNNFSVLALTAIINAAPRLRTLVVNGNGSSTSKYNCQLVQILRGVRVEALARLEELELNIGNGSCFQALRPLPLPNLTTLKLQCSNNNYPRLAPVVDQAQHLNFFLRCNCPRLASLDFYFEPSNGGAAAAAMGVGQEFPLGLPTLPNLTSFGYHGGALDGCCYINVHKAALIPGTMFPSLLRVSTNFGAVLSFGQCIWAGADAGRRVPSGASGVGMAGGEHLANARMKFTQVETLHLKLNHSTAADGSGGTPGQGLTLIGPPAAASPSANASRCSIEDNVHQLRMLYSNLRRLVLDNAPEPEFSAPTGAGDDIMDILHLILIQFRTLESLEIRNYDRDWMHVLAASNGQIIPNLKQLTLSTADSARYGSHQPDSKLPDVNLATVAALLHFLPNLSSLNLSSALLASENWVSSREYANWYPNLKIQII